MRKAPLLDDGPEIFNGPWLPRNQLRKERVLAKYWHDPEVRMSYILDYIPWSWRDIVCICDSPVGSDIKCGRCTKYARWMFRRSCSKCGRSFINDFTHKRKNGMTCFDCLQGKTFDPEAKQAEIGSTRELVDLEAEGVFTIPAVPTFEL